MRASGRGPNLIGLRALEEEGPPEICFLAITQKKGWMLCEDTGRTGPSESQEERLHQRPIFPASWPQTSSFQFCKKINFCCNNKFQSIVFCNNSSSGLINNPTWTINQFSVCLASVSNISKEKKHFNRKNYTKLEGLKISEQFQSKHFSI